MKKEVTESEKPFVVKHANKLIVDRGGSLTLETVLSVTKTEVEVVMDLVSARVTSTSKLSMACDLQLIGVGQKFGVMRG